MQSARVQDPNGFMLIKSCPISSYGIFDYSAAQLGMEGDPNRIVKVYRPESAVSESEAIDSFKNVPFIVDHELLSGFQNDEDATAPEEKGLDGVLTSDVYYDKPWMRGDLKIFSRKAQQALNSGKKDLSLGYSCDFEIKPGVFDGQAYEAIQTKLRGNHIALVDEGRVPGARVLDGLIFDHLSFNAVRSSDEETTMKQNAKSKATMDNAVAQLKALLPALEQYLNEEATEPAHQEQSGAMPEGEDDGEGMPPEMSTEGANSAEGGEPDMAALVSEVEAVLSKLKAAMGGEETQGDESGSATESEGGDAVKGLQESEQTPTAEDGDETGNGSASAGPESGKNEMAEDSAIRRFYADAADKSRIYERLSKVVGAFDHSRMDSRQVCAYGVKKLELNVAKGTERIAMDAYLTGVEKANKTRATLAVRKSATDSAQSDELDAYLKGVK